MEKEYLCSSKGTTAQLISAPGPNKTSKHEGRTYKCLGQFARSTQGVEKLKLILSTLFKALFSFCIILCYQENRYNLIGKKVVEIYQLSGTSQKTSSLSSRISLTSTQSSSKKGPDSAKPSETSKKPSDPSEPSEPSKADFDSIEFSEVKSKDTLITNNSSDEAVDTFLNQFFIEVQSSQDDQTDKYYTLSNRKKEHIDTSEYDGIRETLISVENCIRNDLAQQPQNEFELSDLDTINTLSHLTGIRLSYNHQQLYRHLKAIFMTMRNEGTLVSDTTFATINANQAYVQLDDRISLEQFFAYLSLKIFIQSHPKLNHLKLFDAYAVVCNNAKEVNIEFALPYNAPSVTTNNDTNLKIFYPKGNTSLTLTKDELQIFIDAGIDLTKLHNAQTNSLTFPVANMEYSIFKNYSMHSKLEFIGETTMYKNQRDYIRAYLEHRFMKTHHINPLFMSKGFLKFTIPLRGQKKI